MTTQFGWPRIEEEVSGVVNGSNTLFETAKAYRPGSLVVFRNGQSLVGSTEDGFTEIGPKRFRVKEAPLVEDIIGAYYIVDEL